MMRSGRFSDFLEGCISVILSRYARLPANVLMSQVETWTELPWQADNGRDRAITGPAGICYIAWVESKSSQPGREFFTTPQQMSQHHYEVLRAHHVDGLTLTQAGEKFGYARKVTTQAIRGERDGRGIKFATLRMRSPALVCADALSATPLARHPRNHHHQHHRPHRPPSLLTRPPPGCPPADTTVPWWHGRRLQFEFT
jgi:hypothetical protein